MRVILYERSELLEGISCISFSAIIHLLQERCMFSIILRVMLPAVM